MSVDFAYAQARAQARHGDRLSAARWRMLESSRGLAQYVHTARGTMLAPRVRHFSATSSAHAIERSLRRDWRAAVRNASRWPPRRWREAVAWTAWLPDLPALSHLMAGGAVLPWMEDDPVLSAFALHDAEARRQVIGRWARDASPAADGQDGLLFWWTERWQALWPACGAHQKALLELLHLLHGHIDLMRDVAVGPATAEDIRQDLERQVVRLLRTRTQQPVTVFCHLLLTAVEFWRLRSGLIRRALPDAVVAEHRQ